MPSPRSAFDPALLGAARTLCAEWEKALRGSSLAESVIARNPYGIECRVPAYPSPCSYVRIVLFTNEEVLELVYWDANEIAENGDTLGAVMGAIKQVNDGGSFAALVRAARETSDGD